MAPGADPTLRTAALAALEAGINRALALDPAGQQALAQLSGYVFAIDCTAPALRVYLQPGEHGLRLMGHYDGPVTTRVTGVASDFTQLASSRDPAAALINGQLVLEGDSGPLIELQKILAGLELDWEAPLVDTLGDVMGHQLAQLLRASFTTGSSISRSLIRQLDEFIHEEARLSPPRLEVEDFYRDVQALEQRVERLQSRINRLRKRLHQAAE
ncbi:MAG TPA: SCP2 sterol-binding domain-containing protein [Kineobactrum sp.]